MHMFNKLHLWYKQKHQIIQIFLITTCYAEQAVHIEDWDLIIILEL